MLLWKLACVALKKIYSGIYDNVIVISGWSLKHSSNFNTVVMNGQNSALNIFLLSFDIFYYYSLKDVIDGLM